MNQQRIRAPAGTEAMQRLKEPDVLGKHINIEYLQFGKVRRANNVTLLGVTDFESVKLLLRKLQFTMTFIGPDYSIRKIWKAVSGEKVFDNSENNPESTPWPRPALDIHLAQKRSFSAPTDAEIRRVEEQLERRLLRGSVR